MKGEPNIVRPNGTGGISRSARALFEAIEPVLAAEGGPGRIDYKGLARQFAVTRPAVSEWLVELVEAGLIVRTCRKGGFALKRKQEAARVDLPAAVLPDAGFIRPIPKHRLMAGRA